MASEIKEQIKRKNLHTSINKKILPTEMTTAALKSS